MPPLIADLAYWQETVLRGLVGLVAVLLPTGALVYLFLFKMMSFMQSRLGPMETGPYGQLQLLAEFGKFLQKEDIFPAKADRYVFALAPVVVLISTFMMVLVLPLLYACNRGGGGGSGGTAIVVAHDLRL